MIEIQDMSFTYKDEANPALQDICLSVPEGGFLAWCRTIIPAIFMEASW